MKKSYPEITQRINSNIQVLREGITDTLKGFGDMATSATKDGVLSKSKKAKELIALAIRVSTRCDACIGFYTKALVRLVVIREKFAEVLGRAVYMVGGPSLMYAADAMLAYE